MVPTSPRPSWQPWMTSLAIHVGLLLLLLGWTSRSDRTVAPTPDTLLIDLAMSGLPGDTRAMRSDAPRPDVARDTAPQRAPQIRPVEPVDTRTEALTEPGEARSEIRPDTGTLPTAPRNRERQEGREAEGDRQTDLARALRERQSLERRTDRELDRLPGDMLPEGPSGDSPDSSGREVGGLGGNGAGMTGELSGRALLAQPEPVYPPSYGAEGLEGTVVLRIRVAPDGHVESADVVRSSTRRQFDQSARNAALNYRFAPLPLHVVQVTQTGELTVTFKIP
ncbi:MAG: energy transducer TonB [bacterium]|nr:energy transducer TonB [bacterium]